MASPPFAGPGSGGEGGHLQLLRADEPAAVTSVGQPATPAEYFADLRLVCSLINGAWPHSRNLIAGPGTAQCLDQYIASTPSPTPRRWTRGRPPPSSPPPPASSTATACETSASSWRPPRTAPPGKPPEAGGSAATTAPGTTTPTGSVTRSSP